MKRLKYPSVLPFCNLYKLFHCSAIAVFTSHHSSLLISRVFSGGKVRQVTQVFSLIQQSSKMTNENLFDNSFALHTVRNTCSYLCTNIKKQVVHFLIWVVFFIARWWCYPGQPPYLKVWRLGNTVHQLWLRVSNKHRVHLASFSFSLLRSWSARQVQQQRNNQMLLFTLDCGTLVSRTNLP